MLGKIEGKRRRGRQRMRWLDDVTDSTDMSLSILCHPLFLLPSILPSIRVFSSESVLHTNSQSLLKLMSIESVMPSNHLILCHPLLLLPSILPSIRVFYKESVLCIHTLPGAHEPSLWLQPHQKQICRSWRAREGVLRID